jgi:aminopeptidase N
VEIELSVPSTEWIIGNIKHAGYYRVNYDTQNWKLLINQLNNKEHKLIGVVNRAELIDDAFNLGKAEWIDQLVFFDLVKYLKKEEDPMPFVTAFAGLNTV